MIEFQTTSQSTAAETRPHGAWRLAGGAACPKDQEPRRILRNADSCSDALFRMHDEVADSIDVAPYLDEASINRYRDLFQTLDKLEVGEDPEEQVEKGAVLSAKRLVSAFLIGKWPAPTMAWHGGDAVVLYWTVGDTTFLFTVTDGEVSYSERRGRSIARRSDPRPIDQNWLCCLE